MKWSKKKRRIALDLASQGLNDSAIAAQLGVSASIFSQWRSTRENFEADLTSAREPVLAVKRVLVLLRIPITSARGRQLIKQATGDDRKQRRVLVRHQPKGNAVVEASFSEIKRELQSTKLENLING